MPPIDLDQSKGVAHYLRIADDLRRRILEGAIASGARLPTTRDMARSLGVNRNTVVAAYNKLVEWGFARPHVGRGTFAARPESAPAPFSDGLEGRAERDGRPPSAPWTGAFSRALEGRKLASLAPGHASPGGRKAISFAGSFPAPELLPAKRFLRALEAAMKDGRASTLSYAPAQGLPPLRKWIAQEMTRRGTPTSAEEVLITNGSQQAIDLIARAFVDHGDLVLIENPTYSGAISSFESFGARLAGLQLDEDGILPGGIARSAGRTGAKLLYVTPSFQNPTTAVMPLPRRRQVLEEAAASNLMVIEDDWACGLRFEGADPPTLRSLDREGRVIYLSTFAKQLIPGLRIGWIAGPRPVVDRLSVLKQINDYCSSPLMQVALEEFCRGGGLARHLAMVRPAYRERRNTMLAALEKHFPAGATWTKPEGGLFLWVRLPGELAAAELQAEAERRGVIVSGGDPFHLEGRGPASLRLTFASANTAEIERGIRSLGSILKKMLSASGRRRQEPVAEAYPLV